jgi:hypothetical protein
MKKIFAILAVLAFFMVPAASMAMVQTTDADLATITGAGVQIDISSLTVGLSLDSITWGDYNVKGFNIVGPSGVVNFNTGGDINILPLPGTMHINVNGIASITQGFYDVIHVATTSPGAKGYDTIDNADLVVTINVGTTGATGLLGPTGKYSGTLNPLAGADANGYTAIQIGFVNGVHVALDGFVADIVLDATDAAFIDWQSYTTTGYIPKYNAKAGFNNMDNTGGMGAGGTLAAKSLGIFGIAGLKANVTGQVDPVHPGVNVTNIPFYVTISAH